MTQRQITHHATRLPACPTCAQLPKHYIDDRAARCGGGHFLECVPCDRRTPRQTTLERACIE